MSTNEKLDYARIAKYLTREESKPGFPRDNTPLAYALRFDGSLVVVAANGKKFIFTQPEVFSAAEDLKAMEKKTTNQSKPTSKPTTPKKTG
jgi:hypothetical protein